MSKMEYKPLREYGKLSPESKKEVFEYVRWLRDLETEERLRRVSKAWRVRCSNEGSRNQKAKGKPLLFVELGSIIKPKTLSLSCHMIQLYERYRNTVRYKRDELNRSITP